MVDSTEKVIQAPGLINKELLDACIHCGLCLPACPTYLATGREMESPRGRIYLLSQWNSGDQEMTPRLAEHIDTCLGCLGCQTACPSGVQYEKILAAARPQIATFRSGLKRLIMRFSFRNVLPNYPLLHFLGFFLKVWQKLRFGAVLRWLAFPGDEQLRAWQRGELINPARKFLARLTEMEELSPAVPPFERLPERIPGDGAPVNLFAGCIMDVFYNDVNHACARLLAAQNRPVCVPSQTCCGALAAHAGDVDIARELAKKNIELWEKVEGPVAVTAAGCGAMLKEYGELLEDEPAWADRAHRFSERIKDITEVLAEGKFPAPKGTALQDRFSSPLRVAYHAACHLAHAQGVRKQPETLLLDAEQAAKARGIGFDSVPLREGEHCCGSAGIYNLLHTRLSMEVLERKMDFIKQTGANVVVTTNPGCMLQLQCGAKGSGMSLAVVHLCDFLDVLYNGDRSRGKAL